jgi:hypothetical protein
VIVAAAPAVATPAVVLRSFAAASGRGDAAAMWKLLSPSSQRRLGPYARFRGRAPHVPSGQVIVDTVVDATWGVAALGGARGSYAAALRRVGVAWRIELGAPIRLTAIGNNEVGVVARAPLQLAAGIRSAAAVGKAGMWLDGFGFDIKGGGTSNSNITIYGTPPRPVGRGRHVLVAFATAGNDAAARAWTFTVR